MSVNIRGMGEQHKLDWIRRLRQVNKVALVCIQETQLQLGVEESAITKGWGRKLWLRLC